MTQPKPPDRHHHGALRQAVIDHALRAAQEGALDGLSLREVARELGVSPGAVYRHFPDREAVLRAVAAAGFARLAGAFDNAAPMDEAVTDPARAIARFEALGAAYAGFARDHYGLWRLMFGPQGQAAMPEGGGRSAFDWLVRVLDDLAALGVIARADTPARMLAWAAIHGLSDLRARGGLSPDTLRQEAAQIARGVLRALA